MKSVIILAFSALLSLSGAAPTPDPVPLPAEWEPITRDEILARINSSPTKVDGGLAKRTPGNVYLCTGSHWTGTCAVVSFGTDYPTCHTIPSPFYEHTGSFGPDAGALCRLTIGPATTCNSQGNLMIQHPGIDNLYSYNGVDYGHSARFVSCYTCTACT